MTQRKKYVIIVDAGKCIDCKACMIACKVENNVPEGFWRNWINVLGGENGSVRTEFQPGQCMQCDDPSCVAACPVQATYKKENGLVVIDPEKCIGCGNCVTACPYKARYRNPQKRIADKCDFCEDRLDRGKEPACVVTCPTKARVFGDLNDPASRVAQMFKKEELVQIAAPHINTRPNLYYFKGTRILDWAVTPMLPGNVNMPRKFWKNGSPLKQG
ncbi:4Fe-4S dicluster domain-containing protein [Desulfobacula sp.]